MQERVSVGQNVIRASDDPLGLNQLLDLSETIETDDQYLENIQAGLSELAVVDGALNDTVSLIQRAVELITQAATFTAADTDSLSAIRDEIDEIVDQLVQIGNTELSGRFLFGGTNTGVPPFDRVVNAGQDDVVYNGTPQAAQLISRDLKFQKAFELRLIERGMLFLEQ